MYKMNYDKIENERVVQSITLEQFCKDLGMTPEGYKKMLGKQTMKVSTLELIVNRLKKPVSSFFEGTEQLNITQTHNGRGDNNMTLDGCRSLLAEKERQIAELKRDKEFLQELLKSK